MPWGNMTQQLAYAIITDKSLKRSATGHIIAELFRGVSPLELVAARMYTPSKQLIEEYAATMNNKMFEEYLIRDYIDENNKPDQATPKRAMFLLFKGENAIDQIRGVVGHATKRIDGTIRNMFADYIEEGGNILGFKDPAVLILPDDYDAEKKLKIWAKYAGAEADSGIISKIHWEKEFDQWSDDNFRALKHREGIENVSKRDLLLNIETTLTLIKPGEDITKSPSLGYIVSMFSGPGMKLIGCKAVRMSINQAMNFYAPIKGKIDDAEFYKLITYMTGKDPREVLEPKEREALGELEHLSLALVWRGPFAISRIRKKLGVTNPKDAAPGTIRSLFGHSIMENGAHASDSAESAEREIEITDIKGTTLKEYVDNFYEMRR